MSNGQDTSIKPVDFNGKWSVQAFFTPFAKPMVIPCGRCSSVAYSRVETRVIDSGYGCWKCCCCAFCKDKYEKIHICGNCGDVLALVRSIPGVVL